MPRATDAELVVRLATEVVVAYIAKNEIERSAVPDFISAVRRALSADLQQTGEVEIPIPLQVSSQPQASALAAVEALVGGAKASPAAGVTLVAPVPAVPVHESVAEDYIVSLEDGKHFRSLRRHLMAKYGMTPDDYRRKWDLPDDYPMVAPSYANDRSAIAKRIGLGRPQAKGRVKAKR